MMEQISILDLAWALDGVRTATGWMCRCPAHNDRHPSLSINQGENGKVLFFCHAGCTQEAVIDALKDRGLWNGNGSAPHPLPKQQKEKAAALIPIPAKARSVFSEYVRTAWSVKKNGQASGAWKYRDAAGNWLFSVIRHEKDGGKKIVPYYYGTDAKAHQGNPYTMNRPLYNLDGLARNPGKPVVIVEGEKCADAGNTVLGSHYVFTTWPGGAMAVGKADLTLLYERQIAVWPDRDDPGRQAAAAIKKILPTAKVSDPGRGDDGWDIADAIAEGWDADRLIAFIEAEEPEEVPVLLLEAGEMPRAMIESLDILKHDPSIYQYGEERTTLARITGNRMERIGIPWLLGALDRRAKFMKWDARKNGYTRRDAPEKLAQLILDSRGHEWGFRHVRGIIPGPIIRPDGSILGTPGYDPGTGLLLAPTTTIPQMKEEPTPDDARAAILELWEPFRLFPFAEGKDRTNALSVLLTAAVRAVLPTAPGFLVDAPDTGTGKTRFSRCVGGIAAGNLPPVYGWPENEDELRKNILSNLLDAPAVIIYDNLMGDLRSPNIARVLTADRIADRILGQSLKVDVPTRAIFLFTGNNVELRGDLPRRFLKIRLDCQTESPWSREFDFDPLDIVATGWMQLRTAALTVIRAFFVAGAPKNGAGQLGSFEKWDRMIRQAVVWIRDNDLAPFEVLDPLNSVTTGKSENPDTVQLMALMAAWQEQYGPDAVSVQQAIEDATRTNSFDGHAPAEGLLYQILYDIGGEKGFINAKRIGRFIGYRCDRVLSGVSFTTAPGKAQGGVTRWMVKSTDGVPFN